MEDLERLGELNPTVPGQQLASTDTTIPVLQEKSPPPEEKLFPDYLDDESKPVEQVIQPEIPPVNQPIPAPAPPPQARNNRRNRANHNNNVPPLVAANPAPAPARPTLTTHQVLKEKKHTFAAYLVFLFTIFVFWKTLTEQYDIDCNVTGYLQPSFFKNDITTNTTNITDSGNTDVTNVTIAAAQENQTLTEASPPTTENTPEAPKDDSAVAKLGSGLKLLWGLVPESWQLWSSPAAQTEAAETAPSQSKKCAAARHWYYYLIAADVLVALVSIGKLTPKPMGDYFFERWYGQPFVTPMTSKAVITVSIWFLIHFRRYSGEGWFYDMLNLVSRPSHLVLATWLIGSLFCAHAKSRTQYKGLQSTYIPRVGPLKSMAQFSFNLLPASLVLVAWLSYFGILSEESGAYWIDSILQKWAWTSFGYSVILAGLALIIGGFYFLTNSWGMCFSLYYTGLSQNYSIDVPLVYIILALNEKKFLIPKIGLIDNSYIILVVFFLKTLNLLIHNQNRRNAIDRNQIVFAAQTLIDLASKVPERPAAAEKTTKSAIKRKYKRASGGMQKLIVPEWFNKKTVDSDSFACCICMTRRSNCVMLPCFHSELCHMCAVDIMKDPSRRCYLCLTPISAIHRLKIDFEMNKDVLFVEPTTEPVASADVKPAEEDMKNKPKTESKGPKRFDKGLLSAETMSFE